MSLDYAPNINYLWTNLLIEELCRSGCDHFVISPGSRSSALIGAVVSNKKACFMQTFDERSAGFYALGYAKATNKPAALIVTSGTALANLMPAVVEAALARVPLLILSADRPWELRDVEANQSIDQVKFFKDYTRWYSELPCADDKTPLSLILSTASYGVYRSQSPTPGPVHINCLFREPLAPLEQEFKADTSILKNYYASSQSFTSYAYPKKYCEPHSYEHIVSLISKAQQGLLLIGSINYKNYKSVLKLIKYLNWPTCADISSHLRFKSEPLILEHDHHALPKLLAQGLNFDVVVQIGGRFLSKTIEQLLNLRKYQTHIIIDDHCMRLDPTLSTTHRIESDINLFCEELRNKLKPAKSSIALGLLQEASKQARLSIEKIIEEEENMSEPFVARFISKTISASSALMACTSMPIRDYHMFGVAREDGGPHIIVNRGASGIDGLMSTAIGFAHASQKPLTVLIGDLAFMHDANALALLKHIKTPVSIVLINNQGGAIFSFLPIAAYSHIMTPLIDAPHDYNLKFLAHAFGIDYTFAQTKLEFMNSYELSQRNKSHKIIEVRTERKNNFSLHERIRHSML